MKHFTICGAAVVATGIFATVAHSAPVQIFTDQTSFEAAVASIVMEDFNGDASSFAPNSVGNSVGSQTTVDVLGGVNDSGPTGLTGTGFFQSEVDSSPIGTEDGIAIAFNTGNVFGFGLVGLQNNDVSSPGGLGLQEIGILFANEIFLVSDALGLTDSANGLEVGVTENTDPVFIGFLSDTVQIGFAVLHGDSVAPGGVSGDSAEYYVDALLLGTGEQPPAVPLPAGFPLMAAGLAAFGFMRRRKT